MPYDYKYIIYYPNNLKDLSILNSSNRNVIKKYLKKNNSANLLDINYWNYNLIIDSYDKHTKNFQISFTNVFLLTKNNNDARLDLKKYFINNFSLFDKKYKKKIIESY